MMRVEEEVRFHLVDGDAGYAQHGGTLLGDPGVAEGLRSGSVHPWRGFDAKGVGDVDLGDDAGRNSSSTGMDEGFEDCEADMLRGVDDGGPGGVPAAVAEQGA